VITTSDFRPRARRLAASTIQHSWDVISRLGAITPDDARGRRFGSLGRASCIAFPPGALFGEQWIHVGEETLIGPHVSLSAGMVPGQQMVTNPVISIGNRCTIGRGSHIVGHLSIEIGDDVWTGPYVYVTDQNHGYTDINTPIGRQWPIDDVVRIGAGSWLGAGVAVLPGSDVGEHVVVAAGSIVRGSIPPRCVVVGSPARIVRWYDDDAGVWVSDRPHPLQAGAPNAPAPVH
jgi:acetyltransferase-like isoleucine patch superfamily enzyme